MFDRSFERSFTLDFHKTLFTIALVFIGIFWVLGLIGSLSTFTEGAGEGVLALVMFLIFGTFGVLFWTIMIRVSLEFYVAMMRTQRDVKRLAEDDTTSSTS
ncbi:hypothetical protein CGLAU_02670 [Corynebacterium glaucum]|uniref:DUF4282 domain-containing protein n=1 Tax=Corynebacterium glaucum TaxID=187491 RepID=A0A1Q2HUK0_9CORY|nr:DUF4282 domain-containing protein [Corynebacterium glaucum]AQQ14519.1 hypothetical protein CGLAU_02670 [Corynebacterium glaucum]